MNVNTMRIALILLATIMCAAPHSIHCADRRLVSMTLVRNASSLGAYCLDGSLPAYHLDRGFGAGRSNWLLQFEIIDRFPVKPIESIRFSSVLQHRVLNSLKGGGWCNDIESCLERAGTRRGSTRYMSKVEVFSGILSNNASLNPDFYNWNRVKIRYCDGASFSGDAKFDNGALLSGCSAGGLASFLHCDNFTSYLPKNASVKCLSDAGFFLDARDVGLNHTMRSFFKDLVSLQGAKTILEKNCTSSLYPELCFFPQYALPHIRTPLFILNSAYDVYQFHHGLVPPAADPHGHWYHCKFNPAACNAVQIDTLQGFRKYMLEALKVFFNNSTRGGMFINSCFAHCQSENQDTWLAQYSPRVNNKTIAEAVGDWYFSRNVSKMIDCAYPCDKTCHNLIG
ncbi:hypothetical protein F511_11187 [Dorcoceras hygrometricum]|uniref:Pectin acetylesterase n=1 Tax=Dorcoceras hygrometricum TaxID=472368 RepID=A0A2Z7B206_9LAMI|nr:hypothetical protein F511_11187 [Dorcoceras hygrometricum]